MTTRQGTNNPYARKPTYGKDVCELMRRVNALEYRTCPMDSASSAEFDGYNGGYMLAVTPSGSSVWVVGWKLHEDSTETSARYRVKIWSAAPPSGSTGSWTVADHGELSNGETDFRLKWPMLPEWCGCDGAGRLYLKIRWAYDTIPGGTPASTFIRTNGGFGFSYTRLTHSVPSGMVNFADTPYKILGAYEDEYAVESGVVGYNKCWTRGVSSGIEVHGFCGYGLNDYAWTYQCFYNIETYNEDMVLTNIRIFYVANGDSYNGIYETFRSPVGRDCDGASEDYGAGFLNLKAMVELNPAVAWTPGSHPEPAEHPEDVFVLGKGGIPVEWMGSGLSTASSTRVLRVPSNVQGVNNSGDPVCAVQQLTSVQDPTTERWTHTLNPNQRRLGRLGPSDGLNPHTIRVALSDTDPNIPGKVFAFGPGPESSRRLLRWRVLERQAPQTEWFGYPVGAARVSLGTPDNGVTVPTNNALIAVGAGPCSEHIIDLREAIKKLVDDNWAGVIYNGTYEPYDLRGWSLAAFDFWGKYAGVTGGFMILTDVSLEHRCKPALYMALAQANHSATSPKQQYGLELESYSGFVQKIPTGKYWQFRKADADAMDGTPMHDIDIGEIRALVEMLEASYNSIVYPITDNEDWIPTMPWREEGS